MATREFISRHVAPRLVEDLADSPVVLLQGPRQSGKTTLAREVGDAAGYAYLNLDDDAVLRAARDDPAGFVTGLPPRFVLDEVQRAPELFLPLKVLVDRDRRPGRCILTGSANVLLLPRLADSLAGRVAIVRLHPLAETELARVEPWFLDALLGDGFRVRTYERLGAELARRVVAGGFPAARQRPSPARRAEWYRDYIDTLVQRDFRDLREVRRLDVVPRLLRLLAAQTAATLNVSALAAPLELSRPTAQAYVTLLEQLYLVTTLPAWHTNRASRLTKAPKLHAGDAGLACALLDVDAATLWSDRTALGPLLETFVVQELRRQASARADRLAFHHFRDRDGVEVDIVIERGARAVAGVEVKAAATVTPKDLRGLRKLRAAAGARFVGGVVLYDGEASVPFGDGLYAVPIRALWEA